MAAAFAVHQAEQLQAPLSSPGRPVFYTHTLCPYAQRVFLALLHKGVPFELVHVDLSDKPRWFCRVSPSRLVPAVVHQGASHVESLDILRWLDGEFQSQQQPLMPPDPRARAQVEALLRQAPSIVSAGLDVVAGTTARHWGIGRRPSAQQRRRFEAQACQPLAEALEALGGPYLGGGGSPSLADMALLPFFERFQLALQLQGDTSLDSGPLAQWLESMGALPCAQLASPDRGLFAEALRRHATLDFFDFERYDACRLHPHLARFAASS